MTQTTTPHAPDWQAIELDYRAGIKSLRQIGDEHHISHVAVAKRAKKHQWARDLAGKIQAQAEAMVNKAAVNSGVNTTKQATEKAVIDANAALQYRIRLEHRADIARARQLFQTLLGELELVTASAHVIQALFDEAYPAPAEDASQTDRNRRARLSKVLDDVLSISGRVDSAKKVTEMLERLVRLEREAFGIKADEGGGEAKSRVVFLPCKDAV